jgi:putative transposase
MSGVLRGPESALNEVAELLNSIAFRRPLLLLLKTCHGSEFAGKMLEK